MFEKNADPNKLLGELNTELQTHQKNLDEQKKIVTNIKILQEQSQTEEEVWTQEKILASIEENKKIAQQIERIKEISKQEANIRRLYQDFEVLVKSYELNFMNLLLLEDRMASSKIIKGILSPSGDARMLALSDLNTQIVNSANEYLTQINLENHSLAVAMELDKDEANGISIIPIVNGTDAGDVTVSQSENNFISFC